MDAEFPGEIGKPEYIDQVVTQGVKSSFRRGVIYRHSITPPMLEVAGTHYEMGLQYGVLLRPEILASLDSFGRIAQWMSDEQGIPLAHLWAFLRAQTEKLANPLPERFLEEARGVADGSGVPLETVLGISLIYDVGQSMGCTGVLMKGPDGTIIHGRNNDTSGFGGEELANLTVVVRHRPEGFNTVTHMDYPLWLGVETGYNDRGLAFSEETLPIREPNPDGFSLPYLIRMALEECSSLAELAPMLDRHPTVGAYGCVWSDRQAGTGVVTELTPKGWVLVEMEGPLHWNFNHFYSSELREQQHPRSRLAGINWDREAIASLFPQKPAYAVKDAIAFLRNQAGPGGIDCSWHGTKFPICNWQGSQMMVFDPRGDGIYLGLGGYYAARQDIYHIHDDLSREPDLFMEAMPLEPVVEQVARIENRLVSREEKMDALVALAQEYPEDANIHFLVAYYGFLDSKLDLMVEYALRACVLDASVPEYRLLAGMAAYGQGDADTAISLLGQVDPTDLYARQQLYRLGVLERAWLECDGQRAAQYAATRDAILDEHGAWEYYQSQLLPLLDALSDEDQQSAESSSLQ